MNKFNSNFDLKSTNQSALNKLNVGSGFFLSLDHSISRVRKIIFLNFNPSVFVYFICLQTLVEFEETQQMRNTHHNNAAQTHRNTRPNRRHPKVPLVKHSRHDWHYHNVVCKRPK